MSVSYTEVKEIFASLLSLMIPIILSQTIYQIGYTVDDYLFADIMSLKGFKETYITDLQGVFNTQYTQMINLRQMSMPDIPFPISDGHWHQSLHPVFLQGH